MEQITTLLRRTTSPRIPSAVSRFLYFRELSLIVGYTRSLMWLALRTAIVQLRNVVLRRHIHIVCTYSTQIR